MMITVHLAARLVAEIPSHSLRYVACQVPRHTALSPANTASGEVFNPDGLTAAHRFLPFGTCLEVGNPRTRKTVIVRVNDRGPFTEGMTLDLSAGAARAIGMRSTQKVSMKRC
jgi:peptidoglycan lytic transglycosylase